MSSRLSGSLGSSASLPSFEAAGVGAHPATLAPAAKAPTAASPKKPLRVNDVFAADRFSPFSIIPSLLVCGFEAKPLWEREWAEQRGLYRREVHDLWGLTDTYELYAPCDLVFLRGAALIGQPLRSAI